MAQHDYNLSNNTGALYRADNNAALQAIATQNSGSTAPAVTFPGMFWLDLSGGGDGVMRRRNQANSAWLTDIGIDQVARNAAAAAQSTADAAMPKAGGTFTGAINLIAATPTGNQAVSRTNADALYQVRLPTTPTTAGTLLYRSAAGWDQTLAPAANGTILALSGGLPTWSTPTTVAAPNSIVRTLPDGTLDPSLIPSVASGLRFRGTFKPAVNAEYPTTGGSGSGGAPAVGDFWVIDGLTTGGYTYLTGSLAGVTVYNGDSIAKSDTNWYRMGSSVELQGYMKVDGSTAMTGNLNMGTNSLIEVGGITARAGSPVPLTNFSLDATNVVVSPQRGTTGSDLAAMAAGRFGSDLGRMQIFVGAGASNTAFLPVRFHSTTETYVAGDYVRSSGRLYRAPGAISAGAFVASQWSQLVDTAGATFTGVVAFNTHMQLYNPGTFRFMRAADSTISSIMFYDSATDASYWNARDAASANLYNAIAVFQDRMELRKATFPDTATHNGATNFKGIAHFWSNLQLYQQANSTQPNFIVTQDVAGGAVRFSKRDATTGAAIYDALYIKDDVCQVRKLNCPDANIVFGGGQTISSAVGAQVTFLDLYCKTTNNDELRFNVRRSANGSAWDTAAWSIQRAVDGTGQTSMEFGPSAENVAVSFWGAYGRSLWIDNTTGFVRTIATLVVGTHCIPATDAAASLGSSANRWNTVYASNGTINTSDAREKTAIIPFNASELAAAGPIMESFGKYNWLANTVDSLTHYGTTAQGVLQNLTDAGAATDGTAVVVHDVWEADPETGADAGDRYSLNYTELFALCLANLNARVAALEGNNDEPVTD